MHKEKISKAIISWYEENKRDLVFRKEITPYKVWISEIMLQQTQVKTMLPYYERFMRRFKTIFDLAETNEEEVIKYWEGLGYYNRARHIHETAQLIVDQFNGVFPCDYEIIRSLKGIGSYTAGAISSIAFNKPYPAVDGNVLRVLSRILGIWEDISLPKTKRNFETIEQELLTNSQPALLTQGLMELGALVCKPQSPKCQKCPVSDICMAYQNGYDHLLPINNKKTKQKTIYKITLIIENEQGEYLLCKRKEKGLLANFWEFIQIDAKSFSEMNQFLQDHDGIIIGQETFLDSMKHVFSHRVWEMKIYYAQFKTGKSLPPYYKWVKKEDFNEKSVITAHKKIMDKYLK